MTTDSNFDAGAYLKSQQEEIKNRKTKKDKAMQFTVIKPKPISQVHETTRGRAESGGAAFQPYRKLPKDAFGNPLQTNMNPEDIIIRRQTRQEIEEEKKKKREQVIEIPVSDNTQSLGE